MSVATIYFITFVDFFCIALVVPLVVSAVLSQGGSVLLSGILESLCACLQFINAPLIGSWSDNAGWKIVLIYTLTLSILSNVILASSTSLTIFFIARIINSAFHHVQVLLKAVIVDVVPEKEQMSAFNKIGALAPLGFIMGPIIGGYLYEASGSFFYIVVAINTLYLVCLGAIASLEEKASKTTSNKEKPGIIANIKQVPWKLLWDIFLFKIGVELAFALWRSVFGVLIRETFNVPTKSVGFVIAFMAISMIITNISMPHIRKKFYATDKHGTRQLKHGILIQSVSFVGMALSPNIYAYSLCITFLALSKVLLDTAWMEMLLNRIKNNDKGVILGAVDGTLPLSGAMSPLLTGIVAEIFGLSITTYLPLIPLGVAALILEKLEKSK